MRLNVLRTFSTMYAVALVWLIILLKGSISEKLFIKTDDERIPLLHTLTSRDGNTTSQFNSTSFPVNTYLQFLQSHLGSSLKLKTGMIDTRFVKQLVGCLHTDPLCAYMLGNLYFQGLTPPGVVSPHDTGKNITRAFVLWHYAASMGNSDAQYQLGLVYSTFYNPPSFTKDAQSILDMLQNKTSRNMTQYNTRYPLNDKINSLLSLFPTEEFQRLFFTMKVLDAKQDPKELPEYEAYLLRKYFKYFFRASGVTQPCLKKNMSPRVEALFLILGQICAANESCSVIEHHVPFHTDRFPLHRRDSLATLYFYLAAQSGHTGAQLALGYRHMHGLGVPERCHTAAAYYLRVAREVINVSAEGVPQASSNIRVSLLGLEPLYDAEKPQSIATSGDLKSHYLELQFHVAQTGDPRTQTAVGKLHFFGLEDIPQDFEKAFHYFTLAAQSDYKEAIAYLGYHYALGLGTPKNLDTAFKLFSYVVSYSQNSLAEFHVVFWGLICKALLENGVCNTTGFVVFHGVVFLGVAHNGLGYIYFKGTESIPVDYTKAFYHFNISASNGFPDAHYNLGAMYISGTGVPQSFIKGFTSLTRAVEQGHSGATYMMGVIHLNGIGTIRDCRLATTLFRRVAMKHFWVVERLQKISIFLQRKRKEEAGYLYWSLAEAGHDTAQSDLAILLDGGGFLTLIGDQTGVPRFLSVLHNILATVPILKRRFFKPISLFSLDHHPSMGVNRAFAQKYWELIADQRSPQGYCRLGDYAYNGWGVTPIYHDTINLKTFRLVTGVDTTDDSTTDTLFVDNDGVSMSGWGNPRELFTSSYARRLLPDYKLAFRFYEATVAAVSSMNSWGARYAAQAEFSLARLHQRGQGVPQDLHIAVENIKRMIQLDVSAASASLGRISIIALRFHSMFLYIYNKSFYGIFLEDKRLLLILFNSFLLVLISIPYAILNGSFRLINAN